MQLSRLGIISVTNNACMCICKTESAFFGYSGICFFLTTWSPGRSVYRVGQQKVCPYWFLNRCICIIACMCSIVTQWCGPGGIEAWSLGLLLPSVLWHCWLGHLTRKYPSPYTYSIILNRSYQSVPVNLVFVWFKCNIHDTTQVYDILNCHCMMLRRQCK